MIYMQLFISLNTVIAYYLVTSVKWRRVGLWWGLTTEIGWGWMFIIGEDWGFMVATVFMAWIAVSRLIDGKKV